MKRFSFVIPGMLLALVLPVQTAGAITSTSFLFPSASRPSLSSAPQVSPLPVQPELDIPRRGGASQILAGLSNVEVNNPSPDGNSSHNTQAETAVAIFGSHVVVGFDDTTSFHAHHGHFTGCFGSYAYSSDGGASFTDGGCIPFPAGGVSFGDPTVTVGPTGIFYYGQVVEDAKGDEYMSVSRSTDGGKTWAQPINASPKVHPGHSGVPFQDKDWLSLGINPSDHAQFILYASWTHFTRTTATIQISHSTDGGGTWSAPADLQTSAGVQGSYTTEDPVSGKAYAFWVNFGKGLNIDLVESISADGGQTWGSARTIFPFLLGVNAVVKCGGVKEGVIQFSPGDPMHAVTNFSLPQASVDPTTQNVYLVESERVDKNVDVVLLSSGDGGRTWHSQLVAPNAQAQFQPSISVDQHGVHLEYYQVTSDGMYYAAGINGTHAMPPVFGQPFAVSGRTLPPPQTNPPLDSFLHPCLMGDYNQIASNGQSITYAWTDTRHFNNSGMDVWSATTSG